MYVRLINYHLKPSVTRAEATPVYDAMHSLMRDLPGFRGIELLVNEETRQAVSLSYWTDSESAKNAGVEILPHLMTRTQAYVDRPPEVSGFEMVSRQVDFAKQGVQ